jgi:hypothetical protein
MEPLCGQEWYDAHINAEYPEQSIEVYFDDKRLANVSSKMKYQKGLFKAIIDAEIEKHIEVYYKHKGKWNWIYTPEQIAQKQTAIVLYEPQLNNPILDQCTAIIEDMTFADMTVCVG